MDMSHCNWIYSILSGEKEQENIVFQNDKLVKSLGRIGFEQLIKESTIDTGNLIDHIYVNEGLKSLNISTQRDSAFYSDHDVITLHIPK